MEKIGDLTKGCIRDLGANAGAEAQRVKSLVNDHILFEAELKQIIKPKGQSDRTSFYRIGGWIAKQICEGKLPAETWEAVLGFAREAAGPESRNPAAVFVSILKKELGYKSNG